MKKSSLSKLPLTLMALPPIVGDDNAVVEAAPPVPVPPIVTLLVAAINSRVPEFAAALSKMRPAPSPRLIVVVAPIFSALALPPFADDWVMVLIPRVRGRALNDAPVAVV